MAQKATNISKTTILPDPSRTEFGRVRYPPGGTLGPRIQTGLQLVAIESGEAAITIDDRRHQLGPGHVCLLGPGGREYFRFARRQPTEHTWCTMYFDAADERINCYRAELPFSLVQTATLRDLIALGLASRSAPGEAGEALAIAIGKATYHAFVAAIGDGAAPTHARPASVERACQFVASRFNQSIQVADLARAAGVSPNQLTRLFKRHLQSTPSRYLWRVRTQQGVALLQNTGLSVAEIAYRVGFATPFHFSRLSKRLYGLSPKALRQQFWGDRKRGDGIATLSRLK